VATVAILLIPKVPQPQKYRLLTIDSTELECANAADGKNTTNGDGVVQKEGEDQGCRVSRER